MDGTIIGIDYPSPRRAAILKAHESNFDAIKSGDEAESEAHVDEYVRYAERKFPEVLDEVIPWDRALS